MTLQLLLQLQDQDGRLISGGRFTPLPPASFRASPVNRVSPKTIAEATVDMSGIGAISKKEVEHSPRTWPCQPGIFMP